MERHASPVGRIRCGFHSLRWSAGFSAALLGIGGLVSGHAAATGYAALGGVGLVLAIARQILIGVSLTEDLVVVERFLLPSMRCPRRDVDSIRVSLRDRMVVAITLYDRGRRAVLEIPYPQDLGRSGADRLGRLLGVHLDTHQLTAGFSDDHSSP